MMKQTTAVTVVIPTHNRTDLLGATLKTIFSQTVLPSEVILADNGTEGKAAALVQAEGWNVRIVNSEPNAKQIARNAGIAAATTEWVATLDDDDLLHPTYLEEALALIESGDLDIISTDHRKFRDGQFEPKTNFEMAPEGYWDFRLPEPEPGEPWFAGKFPLENLLKRVPIYPSTTIIRRDFALEIGGYDPRMKGIMSEDLEFLIRALTFGKLGLINKPLVDYRLHAGNDTVSKTGREVGRWRIFEWANATHTGLPDSFREALEVDLPARRVRIYELAYLSGNKSLMAEVAALMRPADWTSKRKLRRLLSSLPPSIARLAKHGSIAD